MAQARRHCFAAAEELLRISFRACSLQFILGHGVRRGRVPSEDRLQMAEEYEGTLGSKSELS